MVIAEGFAASSMLIAVAVGDAPLPSCRQVALTLGDRVRAKYALIASRYPPEGFVVDFRCKQQRDVALQLERGVKVRDTLLCLFPWTPAFHAGTGEI